MNVDAGRGGTLGILGGTFDPVHEGHLALAREARSVLGLDRILFVPNAQPPHKLHQPVTAARHREAMVRAAIEREPGFELSRIELERPGPSYAVDTVATIAEERRAAGLGEPWFILSAEALEDIGKWHEPERLPGLCRIAVAPRPGAATLDRSWIAGMFPGAEDRFAFLPGPHVDITSTRVRDRVARGEAIDDMVPATVAAYIEAQGLYRGSGTEEPDPDQMSDPDAVAAPDPREARRPGLPSKRDTDGRVARLTVVPGTVDASALALAHRIVELASDKKASDIVLLDVRGQTTMTDYFVICSGASDRQLNAIADGIEVGTKHDGDSPLSREGEASSHWLLLDYGGVIVHVMSGPEREFYQLEKLWADASLLLHVL